MKSWENVGSSRSWRIIVSFSILMMTHSAIAPADAKCKRLTGQTSFAKKLTGPQDCDDSFFALFRYNGDLDLALLNVKDRVGSVPLSEDRLRLLVSNDGFPGPD